MFIELNIWLMNRIFTSTNLNVAMVDLMFQNPVSALFFVLFPESKYKLQRNMLSPGRFLTSRKPSPMWNVCSLY